MSLLLGVFAALALVPSFMFVVSYGLRGWRRTPEGWYLFLGSLLFVLVYGSFLLGRVVGSLGIVYWTFLVAGMAVAQWSLLLLYLRTRRQVERGEICDCCGGVLSGPSGGNGRR